MPRMDRGQGQLGTIAARMDAPGVYDLPTRTRRYFAAALLKEDTGDAAAAERYLAKAILADDHGTCPRCGAEDVDLEDETCAGGCAGIDN